MNKTIIKITIAKIKSGECSIDDEEIKRSPFYEEIKAECIKN